MFPIYRDFPGILIVLIRFWSRLIKGAARRFRSVLYFPGLYRYFDCFDSILEWDGISGMEVVFDSLLFFAVLIV